MQIVNPKIIVPVMTQKMMKDRDKIIEWIGNGARIAYQSFEKANGVETEERLISSCIKLGHTSVLEHFNLTFDFICDRGLSHELVRHRIASYTQESTRYCKYDDENMEFIRMIEYNKITDPVIDSGMNHREQIWKQACSTSEIDYTNMRKFGASPQEARSVLNNSLKTHIRITRNFRNMREFLTLRCAKGAHPHAKELAIPLLLLMKQEFPCIFNDITYDEVFYENYIGDWTAYIEYEKEDSNER